MRAGEATLILEEIDFKTNIVTRDKEGHFKMIKGSIHQEHIIINTHAHNSRAP